MTAIFFSALRLLSLCARGPLRLKLGSQKPQENLGVEDARTSSLSSEAIITSAIRRRIGLTDPCSSKQSFANAYSGSLEYYYHGLEYLEVELLRWHVSAAPSEMKMQRCPPLTSSG
jgi:hypothetical protein